MSDPFLDTDAGAHTEPPRTTRYPSPEVSDAAILAASHNGWSPQRSSRRPPPAAAAFASSSSSSPSRARGYDEHDDDAASMMSPSTSGSPTKRAFDPNALRSHGLVSNSIFKRASPADAAPLPVSPLRTGYGRGSPSRMGVGLGIGVGSGAGQHSPTRPSSRPTMQSSPTRPYNGYNSGFMPTRTPSAEKIVDMTHADDAENNKPQHVHPSALSPRKSRGFEVLTKSSYVSNSPFKNGGAPHEGDHDDDDEHEQRQQRAKPLAMSASAASRLREQRTGSPEEDRASTPRPVLASHDSSQNILDGSDALVRPPLVSHDSSSSVGSRSSSPTKGGLLHSTRLHGPRQMSNGGQATPSSSPQKGQGPRYPERRKTVTFDEEPDVQEFDRESSFDGSSLRSGESNSSMHSRDSHDSQQLDLDDFEEAQFWTRNANADPEQHGHQQRLMVVNGSVEPSPLLPAHNEDNSLLSSDSRDLSASDSSDVEPASPAQHPTAAPPIDDQSFDKSFEKSYATCADNTFEARDVSTTSLGGIQRVDSMVDELLQTEILTSPPVSVQNTGDDEQPEAHPTVPAFPDPNTYMQRSESQSFDAGAEQPSIDESYEQPRRRVTQGKPLPSLPPVGDGEQRTATPTQAEGLLSTPGPREATSSGLPTLPNWSPLVFNDGTMPGGNEEAGVADEAATSEEQKEEEDPAMTPPPSPPKPQTSPRRPGARPHISRDAVLERVAREKRAQAEAEAERQGQQQQQPAARAAELADISLPVSHSQTESLRARPSAPAIRTAQSLVMPALEQVPSHREPEPEATPLPRQDVVEQQVSPLARLGEEMAQAKAQSAQGTADVPRETSSPDGETGWFGSIQSRNTTEACATELGHAAPPQAQLAVPGVPAKGDVDSEELRAPSPTPSNRSGGRLPESNLPPPPPAISPQDYAEQIIARRRSKKGRRKRSMSTGDADVSQPRRTRSPADSSEAEDARVVEEDEGEDGENGEPRGRASIEADLNRSKLMLDNTVQKAIDGGFSNGLCRDISRIFRDGESPYKISDRGAFSGVDDKVSHSTAAGDVDSGKAWRKLRRPSDINEYAEEMRAYRASENPKKAAGKVFVLVDSFHPANLPVPQQTTKFFCILDNGLHVVKTGSTVLRPGQGAVSSIAQEFELIQHKNLQFSLTLFAQRDAHLQEPPKRGMSSPSRKEKTGSVTKSFMSRLLRSPKKEKPSSRDLSSSPERIDPFLSYMNREGAFGRVDLVFESVAAQCLGKCLTVDLSVRGVADPTSSISGQASLNSFRHADFSRNLGRPRGNLRLKLFYLPPMPTVPKNLMPENIRECIQGMENAKWHQAESPRLSGVLTQQGGDCRTWRRRPVKAQGSHLICFNEVTKRPMVKIDLAKAVKIEEAWDPYDPRLMSRSASATRATMVERFNAAEEPDESYHVARSFRVTFGDGERISFFTDTDEEKDKWIDAMADMIHAKRPPNPMWAQVAWEIIRGVESGVRRAGSTAGMTRSTSSSRNLSLRGKGGAGAQAGPAAGGSGGGETSAAGRMSTSASLGGKPLQMPPTVQEEGSLTPTSAQVGSGARRKPVPSEVYGAGSSTPMPNPHEAGGAASARAPSTRVFSSASSTAVGTATPATAALMSPNARTPTIPAALRPGGAGGVGIGAGMVARHHSTMAIPAQAQQPSQHGQHARTRTMSTYGQGGGVLNGHGQTPVRPGGLMGRPTSELFTPVRKSSAVPPAPIVAGMGQEGRKAGRH